MAEKLCDEEECTFPDCPDGDPSHCELGLELMIERAESRAELSRDKEQGL
jgi:hypothetical protein